MLAKIGIHTSRYSEGFENQSLQNCETVMELNKEFYKRRDFNPADTIYGEWLFHIYTIGDVTR
jgi:hypothetical protein